MESGVATHSRETLDVDENPFSSSLPVLTSSSARSSPSRSTPSPANIRPRVKKRVVAQDSDSESQAPPPKSPASGHHITTPQSHSSSTPPTSQDMDVTDKRKGKQKAVDVSDLEEPRLSSDDEAVGERTRSKGAKKRKSTHRVREGKPFIGCIF